MTKTEEVAEKLRQQLAEDMDMDRDIPEEELLGIIDNKIMEESRRTLIPIMVRTEIRRLIFNSMKRYGVLQELLEDDTITEIMINGYQNIFIERSGRLSRSEKSFESKEKLADVAQRIAANSNRMVNQTTPILDTRMSDGSRVNIVLEPIALDGACITIRKFYDTPIGIEQLIALQSITQEVAHFLEMAIKARYNIFVSGGTGSGKTTFLNALSNFIPAEERLITIEDSAELQIRDVEGKPRNLVRLETRNANTEGENAITERDLIKSALRMRPDRIIVGEIRGAEAIDMLQAMNTGMSGSLSTGHSNSARDMLNRIETMVLMGMDMPVSAVRGQIAAALELIVHLGRLRDKSRHVLEIEEILEFENGEIQTKSLFRFVETGEDASGRVLGELRKCADMIQTDKFRAAGVKEYC